MSFAALVIALLGASEVSVDLAPGLKCVERSRLITRLEGAGLRVIEGTSPRLAVTLVPADDSVTVRGERRGAAFERRVPAQLDACPAVERVVAALITSWSRQVPAPEHVEPQPAPAPVRVSARPRPEPTPPLAAETEPEPPAPPVEDEQATAHKTPLVVAPRRAAAVEVAQPTPATSSWPLSVDAALLGGGGYGPTTAIAPMGQLQLAFSIGRLGALLEGGFQTARASEVESIRVEATSQWLSLSPRVHFNPHERLRLDVALGLRVWRIEAQSSNATLSRSLELTAVGGVLSGGSSLHVIGPMSVHLRGFATVRSRGERFVIEGVGPVLELEPWEGGLMLGVEFRLSGR